VPPTDPASLDTLRDILGIARALYVEWSPYAGPIEMDELKSVGRELREAYERLLKARPGTGAYAAAWRQADEATQRLGLLVSEHTSTKAIVRAVGNKLGSSALRRHSIGTRRSASGSSVAEVDYGCVTL
jgi:hypothetical protein